MKTLLTLTPPNRDIFLKGMESLGFTAISRLWLELLRALDTHWPDDDGIDVRSLETVAAEIDIRSNEGGWSITTGRNPRSGTREVCFSSPTLGHFVLRASLQFSATIVVEMQEPLSDGPLRKFWTSIGGK